MGLLGPNISTHSEYSSEFRFKMENEKGSDLTFWYEVDLPEISWVGNFPLPCSLGTASLAYLSANYPWAYILVLYKTTNVIYLIVFFYYSNKLFNTVTSSSSTVAYAMKIANLWINVSGQLNTFFKSDRNIKCQAYQWLQHRSIVSCLAGSSSE